MIRILLYYLLFLYLQCDNKTRILIFKTYILCVVLNPTWLKLGSLKTRQS
nr:MAG TPA: hypothetical protein [Caudoviricetes sp.]